MASLCLSMGTMACSYNRGNGLNYTPSASLSLVTGTRTSTSSVSLNLNPKTSALLHCAFTPSSSLSFSGGSSFSGSSLGLDLNSGVGMGANRRSGLVVRAKKYALCQTKRNRSRKSLARTHGFRLRMSTATGRAVIRRRRAKGRWTLCTKTNPNSGKRRA